MAFYCEQLSQIFMCTVLYTAILNIYHGTVLAGTYVCGLLNSDEQLLTCNIQYCTLIKTNNNDITIKVPGMSIAEVNFLQYWYYQYCILWNSYRTQYSTDSIVQYSFGSTLRSLLIIQELGTLVLISDRLCQDRPPTSGKYL